MLHMEEDREALLMLGRSFLATRQVLIDVKNGELTLRVGKDQVKFNMYQGLKFSNDEKGSCMRVDSLIHSRDGMIYDFMKNDPLGDCLIKSLSTKEWSCEKIATSLDFVETILSLEETEEAVIEEELKTPDGLVLKELPKHLRYALLGENGTKPIIVSATLIEKLEHKLLVVLK